MKTNNNVVCYCRVASANDEAMKAQRVAVEKYAKGNGYTIIKVYEDCGASGNELKRDGLDQLRSDAQSMNWDAVIIADPSRLSRNITHQQLVGDELIGLGIEIISVSQSDYQSTEDKLIHNIKKLLGDYNKAKIGKRTFGMSKNSL